MVERQSLDQTRDLWEQRIGRELSDENCRAAAENVAGYFSLLATWAAERTGDECGIGKRVEDENLPPSRV